MRFSSQKNQETLNVGKIRNCDEERVLFREKNCFHLFKSLLYKNGKAQNMPVVAGRLVINVFKIIAIILATELQISFDKRTN